MCLGVTLLDHRSITVDATLSAVLAGDVAVGVTSPVGFAGSASPDVVFPAVAEVVFG